MFIFLLSLLCGTCVLTRWIQPAFLFVFLALVCFSMKRLGVKKTLLLSALAIGLSLCVRHPYLGPLQEIEGEIVMEEEDKLLLRYHHQYIRLDHQYQDLKAGDIVCGTLIEKEMMSASNFNAFDYKHYAYGSGIFHQGTLENYTVKEEHFSLYHWLYHRIQSQNEWIRPYSSLFLLGIKEDDIRDVYDQLGQLSLVHLFALSGLHIQLLIALLEKLLNRIKYHQVIILLIVGYYVMSLPLMVSFMRAYFMKLLTFITKERLSPLESLSIVFLGFILYNPYIFYNVSFLFSFVMTFFIIVSHSSKYQRYYLYLATIPLILYQRSEISLLSFFLGLVFSPMIKWFYQGILFHFISMNMFSWILEKGIRLFEGLLQSISIQEMMLIFKRPSIFWIVIYYLLLMRLIFHDQRGSLQFKNGCTLGLWLFFLYLSVYLNPIGEVTMIDVGQGDCFLIKEPFMRSVILIDTGGNPYTDLATTSIIPYLKSQGIRQIDRVYISHDDQDHCGALESLLTHFKVKEVQRAFEETTKLGGLTIRMLAYPISLEDTNDQSLVLHMRIGDLYYLFTGDISQNTETFLAHQYPDLKVDVLKVSHHGSRTSSSSQLFQWIHPSIALISVKKNNMYHHPHEDVIHRLEKQSIQIYRSDIHGMVSIHYSRWGSSIFTKKDIHDL